MFGSIMASAKSSFMLIVIGVAMVITMLILAASFLSSGPQGSIPGQSDPVYPTPTPEIQYQPVPEV
jgi:hypothetical protein